MTVETNKALLRRFVEEIVNQGVLLQKRRASGKLCYIQESRGVPS
jgi:hypothetical protein